MTATMKFVAFPDVELLHNVVRMCDTNPSMIPGPVKYKGKIKLHGTNAGITITNGEVSPQSRTQAISIKSDNAGFARWVEGNNDYWENLQNMTVFGEWCGPGVMRGTAVNKIPKKVFAVFAIATEAAFITEPDEIEYVLGSQCPADVHVLPWYGEEFILDFTDRPGLQAAAAKLNAVLEVVEPCDPWVKAVFGVEGTAEGIVYYPSLVDAQQDTRVLFENFTFKVKGEKHSVIKTKEAVQIAPEVAANIEGFTEMFVTEARCEQGLATIGGSLEMKNMGAFLKWMSEDVKKESADELAVSGLTWEQVQKAVNGKARTWFMNKSKAL